MNEGRADEIIAIYQAVAGYWDDNRSRSLFERPWLDRFLALMSPAATVLDLGCGSGEPIAAYLHGNGHPLSGVDSSETMIALCRRRFPDSDWHVADMRALNLGRRFGGLVAWDSFFHLDFDAQRAMFPIFRNHLLSGAPLLFTSGPAHGEMIGEIAGHRLYHASLAPEGYRQLLAENYFAVIDFRAEDRECAGHSVWLARAC
jgi:trans-aconitate methyltransferase